MISRIWEATTAKQM